MLGASAPGCAAEPTAPKESGSVVIEVTSDGEGLGSSSYALSGPDGFSKKGTVTGSTTQETVPAGSGYRIELEAKDRDGERHTGTSGPFDVRGNGKTPVKIYVPCRPPKGTHGNKCPTIESIVAAPGEAEVGQTIALTASATDHDKKPKGGTLTYHWTTIGIGSASFADATAANTQFTCAREGAVTVALTISDGDTTCNDVAAIETRCTTPNCTALTSDECEVARALVDAANRGWFPRQFNFAQAYEIVAELKSIRERKKLVSSRRMAYVDAIIQLKESDDKCRAISGWSCAELLTKPVD